MISENNVSSEIFGDIKKIMFQIRFLVISEKNVSSEIFGDIRK